MRIRVLPFCLIALLLFGGCRARYHSYCHSHQEMPSCSIDNAKPVRVALVLGAGGAKGMVHLGVLHELEAASVPIDLIVGCSAGSIVGALYANNPDIIQVKPAFDGITRRELLDFWPFNNSHSLCFGGGLRQFLACHLQNKRFEDLHIPLAVVATDLVSGQLVFFNSGQVASAVHASSALPFVYSPVKLNNYLFVDGGVINPLPVEVASLYYDADIIIAVDIGITLPKSMPTNIFGLVKRCAEIQHCSAALAGREAAHFLIRPDLTDFGILDDSKKEELYHIGRQEAAALIPKILEAVNAPSK